ncbi:MAG TPA: hypothetical protein VIQ78_06850 [Terrimesophilobacter sp.]|jgi:hypothetical protein|uniref:hypothetical protein n=1 Tax=Terrimesophilobacter sp. TaxID=2906435 RepID=UPI002F94C182
MSVGQFSPALSPKVDTAESRFASRRNASIVLGLVTAVLYSILATASWGYCPGGVTGDGGYLDGAGEPTTVAPQCVSVVMHPNNGIYLVIAVVIAAGIWRARRHVERAVRILGITATVVVAVGVLAVVAGWFLFYQFQPLTWQPGDVVSFPPILNVDVTISPMW